MAAEHAAVSLACRRRDRCGSRPQRRCSGTEQTPESKFGPTTVLGDGIRTRLQVPLSYSPAMTTLADAFALARDDSGLAVVSTLRADNTIQSSLINAGPLPHPATAEPTLGFVTYGRVKLANLRARPQIAVTFRRGWQWATVEGRAELAGPDDQQPWLGPEDTLPRLLRDIFTAAGGTHDDWDAYDRTMREQRRTAVLITPTRVYSNG